MMVVEVYNDRARKMRKALKKMNVTYFSEEWNFPKSTFYIYTASWQNKKDIQEMQKILNHDKKMIPMKKKHEDNIKSIIDKTDEKGIHCYIHKDTNDRKKKFLAFEGDYYDVCDVLKFVKKL